MGIHVISLSGLSWTQYNMGFQSSKYIDIDGKQYHC
jgi:hypothetical protein